MSASKHKSYIQEMEKAGKLDPKEQQQCSDVGKTHKKCCPENNEDGVDSKELDSNVKKSGKHGTKCCPQDNSDEELESSARKKSKMSGKATKRLTKASRDSQGQAANRLQGNASKKSRDKAKKAGKKARGKAKSSKFVVDSNAEDSPSNFSDSEEEEAEMTD
ncbi:hypothetical protein GYMLUDRAFT_63627 [Collybiopsis luxurians FD-317 M1]|uniref:Uncharacterized protein n=1 Tax=Collybiopsis luxurians FD-317 M1 TaxID=944289 RepID=A0A0D0BG57_9AGAR|nr:hypothetical protein GYMLUDRAFT_63627 [Collybiopsis luxurians FD-317 M1]